MCFKLIKIACISVLLLFPLCLSAQTDFADGLLAPADTFNQKRFWAAAGSGALVYTVTVIGLNEAWYADFPRSDFHFFNDLGEWKQLDKTGHFFTTYFESNWSYQGARWTGLPRRKAAWLGAGLGMLYQATVEVFDGFSQKWGFSASDIAANTLGAATFLSQELLWKEQRICLKYSAIPRSYDNFQITSVDGNASTDLHTRIDELYGTSFAEHILKDYNIQTHWASVNIASFMHKDQNRFPKWLNIAVGYGVENMFGGFENKWTYEGNEYHLDEQLYPRYRQIFFSPDIDFTRIQTKSRLLKTFFFIINTLKVPSPAMEVNSLGELNWHWLR